MCNAPSITWRFGSTRLLASIQPCVASRDNVRYTPIMPSTREKRWVALGTDGRHITLGPHSDPTEDEIGRLEAALRAEGTGARLAVAEGDYWNPKVRMTLVMVRSIGNPTGPWEQAVAAFKERRQVSLQPA
jgi:hypothetical protein